MAAESPVLGQLRHIPSASSSSSAGVEPRPLSTSTDPLQGLVHEMALSAVIQKHGSTVSSSPATPVAAPPLSNGAIVKNYYVHSTTTSVASPSAEAPPVSTTLALNQTPSVVLGPNGVQQGFITLATASQAGGGMSLLAHQASPVIQGAPISLPQISGQLQEGSSNMVQLCYGGATAANPQPSPGLEHSAVMQQHPNVLGSVSLLGVQ